MGKRQSRQAGAARGGQADRRCDRARQAHLKHLKVRLRKQAASRVRDHWDGTRLRPEDAVRKKSLIGDAHAGQAGRSEFAFQRVIPGDDGADAAASIVRAPRAYKWWSS